MSISLALVGIIFFVIFVAYLKKPQTAGLIGSLSTIGTAISVVMFILTEISTRIIKFLFFLKI